MHAQVIARYHGHSTHPGCTGKVNELVASLLENDSRFGVRIMQAPVRRIAAETRDMAAQKSSQPNFLSRMRIPRRNTVTAMPIVVSAMAVSA